MIMNKSDSSSLITTTSDIHPCKRPLWIRPIPRIAPVAEGVCPVGAKCQAALGAIGEPHVALCRDVKVVETFLLDDGCGGAEVEGEEKPWKARRLLGAVPLLRVQS